MPEGEKPITRRGHSCNVIGESCMYVFGGLHGYTKYLNDLYVYNGDKHEWKCLNDNIAGTKPEPRAWHTTNVIGQQILLFGGTNGRYSFFNDLWILDTKQSFWFKVMFFCFFLLCF